MLEEDKIMTISFRRDLSGRSVLITGATGALGSATSREMAAAGAKLTIAGGNAEALENLQKELRAAGAEVVAVNRRPVAAADADFIVQQAVGAFGCLDLLLSAAGMNIVAPTVSMSADSFDRVMEANVKGSWLICQAAGRQMIAQGNGGSIVLVSSTRGKLGHPAGYSAYCPSKAAIDLLGKTLAAEWGVHGIRVNVVAPTVFRSDLTAWMFAEDEKGESTRRAMLSRIPLGRLAEPSDVVGPICFFFSGAARFCTGQVLYVDGGYTAC
jgi:NAD(P)-dependent dehydrogenase (short-subunit alcohol dehydrogenase family)